MRRWLMTHAQLLRHGGVWKRRRLLSMMTTVVLSVYTFLLVHVTVTTTLTGQQQMMTSTSRAIDTWSLAANDTRLIDRNDFKYLLQPTRTLLAADQRDVYFVIYVHSAPTHLQARNLIRSTWGSVSGIGRWRVRVIFLLGLTSADVQRQLMTEHERHDDLVQGNFLDSYRNLSYKHVMGYKWILSSCPDIRFIVKCDDDAFVDVIQLYNLLQKMYSQQTGRILACSVWPAGSSPQRQPNRKWAVSTDEYPYEFYPKYCGGLAYVVSPSAARHLLAASLYVPFFWIDDLYVTGLLAQMVPDLRHHSLNLRTTYDSEALVGWLREPVHRYGTRPSPYIFGEVNGSGNAATLMQQLWTKTKSVWKNVQVLALKYIILHPNGTAAMNKHTFRTPGEHGYSLQFSPFYGNQLALVTCQNYGLNGCGKLYYLEVLPNGAVNPLAVCPWSTDALFDVCWSEVDPNVCVTVSGDGSMQLWNRSNPHQPIKMWKEHEKEVYSVQWSQNKAQEQQIVTASWDSTIKVWDPNMTDSLCTLRGHQNIVYSASWAIHMPFTVASASGDQSVRIWDLKSPVEAAVVIPGAHQGEVLHCDWNKYSQNMLASAGTDGVVRGWDIRNPSHFVFELTGHEYGVKRVKFSPHRESVLATISYDFTSRIWDYKRAPHVMEVLTHHNEFVYGLDFNLHIAGQMADCAFDQLLHIYTPHSLSSSFPIS